MTESILLDCQWEYRNEWKYTSLNTTEESGNLIGILNVETETNPFNILIRQEYEDIFQLFLNTSEKRKRHKTRGIILLGTPGIGKSYTLYYFAYG